MNLGVLQLANHPLWRYVFFMFAGLISVFAFAPFDYALVIMISIVLLLWLLELYATEVQSSKNKSWRFFAYGYVYGLAYFGSQLYWVIPSLYVQIHLDLWMAIVAFTLFVGYLALAIAIPIYLYLKYRTTSRVVNVLFIFPSLWVLFEWLRGWLFSGVSWCDVG